jgi:DNA-binding response OmpR family regulator
MRDSTGDIIASASTDMVTLGRYIMQAVILIIEDDPASARLMELMLQSQGYRIVIALDGARGLASARSDPPDLILLDLMLPGDDGFEVLRRLRAEPGTADVPVVVVSSKAQAIDKQVAADAGADAYLTKPYGRVELLSQVRSLLGEESDE